MLLGEAGFEPLGFVVGSSIYHVGIQADRWSQNQELQVLTQAMYNARELAMARMRAEAAQAKASGIVGVTVEVIPGPSRAANLGPPGRAPRKFPPTRPSTR